MNLQLDDNVFARVNPMQFASEDYKTKSSTAGQDVAATVATTLQRALYVFLIWQWTCGNNLLSFSLHSSTFWFCFLQRTVKKCSFGTDLHHRHFYGWKNNKIYVKLKNWFENSLPDMYFKLSSLDLCKIHPGSFNAYWKAQYFFVCLFQDFLMTSKKFIKH